MAAPQAPELAPYRFSRAEYDRMVDLGALDDLPVELIDGVIVEMSPQGAEHIAVIKALTTLLAPIAGMRLGVQGPFAAGDFSEPETDLAVAHGHSASQHPTTAALVVEVVVNQHAAARRKVPVYAAARVEACWIVDVPRRTVEVLTEPDGESFRRTTLLRGDDALAVPGLEVRFTVAEVFSLAGLLPSER